MRGTDSDPRAGRLSGPPVTPMGGTAMPEHGPGSDPSRSGLRPWSVVVLSVLGSAFAMVAVGCVCALFYPIFKELRAERFKGDDQSLQRVLGFWSILVLSVLAGCICCAFSWTLTYLDSYQPGLVLGTPLTLTHFRSESSHSFLMSHGVAVLNGFLAVLTVIWSLT